jgi:two-component system nitrogen regulation sensor histidine kinase GlnL
MVVKRRGRRRATRAQVSLPDPLENVLASLGDAIMLTDEDDRITMFNQAAEELTAVPAGHALALVQRARRSAQSQSCGEENLLVGDRRIPVRLSCSPIWGARDQVQGTAVVIQDLSYQKKLEDESRRNETLARLGALVAGLAHEIKNPLGGIKGAAQLLAKRFGEQPEVGDYTGVMIREIDRLSHLVEQLLTFGALPAPERAPINVHQVIHEVLALMAPELDAKHITRRLQIDPSLPETRGDAGQLHRVFVNLVKNALECMSTHGTLTITTRMETNFHILRRSARDGAGQPGQFLRVEVADSGPGFPPGEVTRVFEPFFTTKPRGSGLGLAICERIVAGHGGDIRAENRGGGAVVIVYLPLLRS